MSIICRRVENDPGNVSQSSPSSTRETSHANPMIINRTETIVFRLGPRRWRLSLETASSLSDPARLEALLTLLSSRIASAPVDARFAWDDIAQRVQIVPGQAGIRLDRDAAATSISTAIATGTSTVITVPVVSAPPTLMTAGLRPLLEEANALVLAAFTGNPSPSLRVTLVAALQVTGSPLVVHLDDGLVTTASAERR